MADSVTGGQMFITVANYKGRIVAVRKLRKDKVKVDRALLQEMMVVSASRKVFGIFTHIKLCFADAIHNFKWVKIIQI